MNNNNYKFLCQALATRNYVSGCKDLDGTSMSLYAPNTVYAQGLTLPGVLSYGGQYSSNMTYQTQPGIYFGSGSKEEVVTDYKLENPILSGITVSNGALGYKDIDGSVRYYRSITVTNTSTSDITIQEIGYVGKYQFNNGSDLKACMIRRDVIEPVTIAPGTSATFNFSIDEYM